MNKSLNYSWGNYVSKERYFKYVLCYFVNKFVINFTHEIFCLQRKRA